MKGERGFALVITLLITALLVALTVEFVSEVFVETSARQGFTDGQQASLLADSGITGGIKYLQFVLRNKDYSSQADMEQFAKFMQIEDETGTVRVTAEDESGKLNINAIVNANGTDNLIYRGIADRLFIKLGLQKELLYPVKDWIDIGESPETTATGAETPYYQTLKPPYGAKNGILETLEELRLVKGFDAKTLDRLRPYITVYPVSASQININTAPKEVIAALADGMTDDLAQRVIDHRPFDNTTNTLFNVPGMETIGIGLSNSTSTKGTVYRIISQATVRETTRIVEAVVNSGGKILYWREY